MGLVVVLFPLGSLTSADEGAPEELDPATLQQFTKTVQSELLGSAGKVLASGGMVEIGGVLVSQSAYKGIKALGDKAKVIVKLNQPSFFQSGSKDFNKFKTNASQIHANALKQVKNVVPGFVKEYDLYGTMNGFTGVVNANQLNAIVSLAGQGDIESVYISEPYTIDNVSDESHAYITYKDMNAIGVSPDMVNSAPLVGAPVAWSMGYTGSGTYVAIIDTGIDYTHENFGGYSSFPNEKIPYGYDFADKDSDPMDKEGHGTHVAGTVAGIGAAQFQDKDGNWVPLKGIAPDAKLIAAKVFADNSPYAYTSEIVAAIEYLIDLKESGVNIVAANMSLGADKGFDDPTDPEQEAIKNAYEAGITFAISAGNNASFDYAALFKNDASQYTSYIKDSARVGSPGSSRYAITVAAVNNQGMVLEGNKLTFGNDYVMYLTGSESPDPVEVFGQNPVTLVDTGSILCSVPPTDYAEKVVLIDRGTCTFEAKVNNARAAGAVGVVIGNNNTDPSLISMALGSAADTIPAVFIGGPDKLKLRAAIASSGGSLQAVFTSELFRNFAPTDPNVIASFTSWGPAPNMAFKPTLAAPGVSIFSSIPGNQYATYQGTSMAAPHVAGAIALLKQAHPDWTPEQVKQALVNTADPIGKYSPRVEGAGRINIGKAIANTVFITYNGQPYAELGSFIGDKTISLTITNSGTVPFDASVTGYVSTSLQQYAYGNQGRAYTVGTLQIPASVSVPAGGSQTLQVGIKPSTSWNNIFIEGRLVFSSSDGTRVFPFLGYLGDWSLYSDKDTINGESRFPDNNNIIDLPWWNSDSWAELTGIYYPYGSSLYYIGMKGDFLFEPKALAISAGSKYTVWNDSLIVGLGMLRNAENLKLSVVNNTGKTVYTIADEKFVRAGVSDDLVSMGLMVGWDYEWLWDGKDSSGKFVPDGQYYIRIEAYPGKLITGQDTLRQIMEIPVLVDRKLPSFATSPFFGVQTIAKNTYLPTASVITLTFTGKDDSSILEYFLGDQEAEALTDENNTATIALRISGIGTKDGEKVAVPMAALDGAGNLATSYASFIYDSPSTPPSLSNVKVNAVPNRVVLSFNVDNAPGSSYLAKFVSSTGTATYETNGLVNSTKFNQTLTMKLDPGTYTMNLAITDIYGVATATQMQIIVK
jgi:lactocepin